jgi:hypothetical protein
LARSDDRAPSRWSPPPSSLIRRYERPPLFYVRCSSVELATRATAAPGVALRSRRGASLQLCSPANALSLGARRSVDGFGWAKSD